MKLFNFKKKISVNQNNTGYLFKKKQLFKILKPGIYYFRDFKDELELICLSNVLRTLNVYNQEVLTKDNIALRFSFFVEYQLADGEKFLNSFNITADTYNYYEELETLIHNYTQIYLRKIISALDSEELNIEKNKLIREVPEELVEKFNEYGILFKNMLLKDITYPKNIQNLFAKNLESKIRSRTDLENARTAVATARALKNASQLMKDDDNIRFFQFLETVNKIAEKGRHTFMLGDWINLKK